MRNIKLSYKILLIVIVLMTSCNKDILELQPLDAYSDAAIWKDSKLTETFVNGIYMQMDMGFNKYTIGNYVDETHRRGGRNQARFCNSQLTPDQIPAWNYLPSWESQYLAIRACNKFFENIEQLPDDGVLVDGVTIKNRMIGEVHFLRAYFYSNLVNLFGGVPIITKAYQLDDDFAVPRDTYSDCVKFIADECDLAASILPLIQSGDNRGRATIGAALALKSEQLLYAASDLHNTTVFPNYSNPELIGYTDANTTARWQAAKDAAKNVMDLGIYSLFRANPSPTDSVAQNFVDLFLSYGNEEDIFVRFFTPTSFDPRESSWMNLTGSNGYHCRGSNAPIDNLVRDYELKDGTKFDWNNPVHAAAPYINRDPRFYATIFYEGAKWRQRALGEVALDPIGEMQLGVWQKWDAETSSMYEVWGLDTRKSPVSPSEGGYTGYYIRKWFDKEIDAQFIADDPPWRFFRYAEILLNYAEACIGLGQDDEARTYINMVRKRAGMPDVTESGIALRDHYRNERRIELANESKRFYDVRRWLIAPQVYGEGAYKVLIVYELLPDHTTATIPTITPVLHDPWAWIDKAYFFPIFRDEMNKNDKLIQNPDY